MSDLPNKLVAVLNKSLEPGVAMNALSHMSFGLGARLGVEEADLVNYTSQDQTVFPGISKMPFIVARGTGGKIRTLMQMAETAGIKWAVFTDTMTIGTWDEQIARTADTDLDKLTFYGIVLFGPKEVVTELTKKFSLWH